MNYPFSDESVRAQFPAAASYTYLNSAAVSPIPLAAVDAVAGQLRDVAANGSSNFNNWVATKDRARVLLAGMMNVPPDQVAFLRNTSDGFASIANGLQWSPDDNIVSFEREFPSNYYAWRRVRDKYGVELRLCPEREGRIDLTEFASLIDSNTKVVSISAVQYGSGFQADLESIGRAARQHDALFCVDVIQGLGGRGYDLPAALVDAACGASHKWLCAPEGCGFIYLSDRARDRIDPTLVGWISVETPWDFEDREQPFKSDARAWESGTGSAALFYGLEQSLKLLNETGLGRIERYLLELTDYLCDSLASKNYEIISSRSGNERSPIVCIRHNAGMDPHQIAAHLEREKVIVSPRGDRIRISPHFYNNSEDIDRLVSLLP